MIYRNSSFTFVVPYLGVPLSAYYNGNTPYIINSYLFTEEDNSLYRVHLLLTKEPYFRLLENKLMETGLFISSRQINGYVLMSFNIPERFKPDYDLFLEGQYSKFSQHAKDMICELCYSSKVNPKPIFDKSPEARLRLEKEVINDITIPEKFWIRVPEGNECWELPSKERETFTLGILRAEVNKFLKKDNIDDKE